MMSEDSPAECLMAAGGTTYQISVDGWEGTLAIWSELEHGQHLRLARLPVAKYNHLHRCQLATIRAGRLQQSCNWSTQAIRTCLGALNNILISQPRDKVLPDRFSPLSHLDDPCEKDTNGVTPGQRADVAAREDDVVEEDDVHRVPGPSVIW